MGLLNGYPYTDFHNVNLDYVIQLCRKTQGLHLEVSGNNLLLKSADGTVISCVDVSHAQQADLAALATRATTADAATTAINANYATSAGSAATADSATNAAHAVTADTALTANTANSATNANHASAAEIATLAVNATNAETAAYAETTGNVEHASKAVEKIENNGNYLRYTLGDGSTVDVALQYAQRASHDSSANYITQTYVANVVDDNGVLKFLNAQGGVIVSITPTVASATEDSYGNTIAEYIKALVVSDNNNYVTVNHGDGTTESIIIPYSEKAWKDTNGNIIKNSYVKRLAVEVDPNDGKRKLVAYNGDNPEAEIFRIELNCYSSQISDYASHAAVADLAIKANEATMANVSNSANNSFYVLKAMAEQNDDHIFNITGCYDANGNEVDFEDIPTTAPLIIAWQTYFISGDPGTYYYPVSRIHTPHTGEKMPIFLNYDNVEVMGDSDSSTGYSLTHNHLDIVYSNGSWFAGNKVQETYEIALTPMQI